MAHLIRLAGLLLAALPGQALACSVCFGDPNSAMTKGALAGVLVLLAFIVFVLAAVASVAVFWAYRARMLQAAQESLEGMAGGRAPTG
jgi:membrane protein implicated in regulation of membrane protease activity